MYISEAHAVDVWPIGLSAGVLNKKHQNIVNRAECATNFINEYDFNILTYLDNMSNELQTKLSAWPFRFYLIKYNELIDKFVFKYIAEPSDAEFDLTIISKLI